MLKNFWYAVEFSKDITRTPKKVVCLGQKLVVWRTRHGKVNVLSDLCVHRGALLSDGWLTPDSEQIVCPYHGWQYQGDGACTKIPAHPERGIPKKARVDSYPVVEKYDLVWVFLGDLPEAERPPIPEWPEFDDPSFHRVYGEFPNWPANYERILENGTDVAHAPFVHGGVFGNPERPEVPENVIETTPWSASTEISLPARKPTGLWSFVSKGSRKLSERPPVTVRTTWWLPNLIKLDVRLPMGRLIIYDTNIPVSDTETNVKWIAMRNFFPQKIFDRDTRRRVNGIFKEDAAIVNSQRPELLPFDLSSELHVKSDGMAVAYRRRRQELIEMGWGIEADKIIGDGPRTEAVVIPSPARREIPELARAWVMKAVPTSMRDAVDEAITASTLEENQ